MANLVVVDRLAGWSDRFAGAEMVRAHDYLTDPRFTALRGARVFNLCQSYRYQRSGYYVSLLAGARGHRPLPDVSIHARGRVAGDRRGTNHPRRLHAGSAEFDALFIRETTGSTTTPTGSRGAPRPRGWS
jgi:hypothetical protein